MLDYSNLISNPYSEQGDEALRNIINVPNRYIGRKFMAELDEFQSGSDMHLYEKLKAMPVELPYIRKECKRVYQVYGPTDRRC